MSRIFGKIGHEEEHEKFGVLIGPGTEFQGKLSASGSVRVDGVITGELSLTGSLIVGQQGAVQSPVIYAKSAVIAGTINGDIVAQDRITLKSTAKLFGNITTKVLVIEAGAIFNGRSTMEDILTDYSSSEVKNE